MGPGAALALLVHAGLIGALALGVNWRMKAPETVSAELWAALPQMAAPKAETPPPSPAPLPTPAPAPAPAAAPPPAQAAPTEAQIAIERAEQRRLERDKKAEAAQLKAQAEADAAKAARDEKLAQKKLEQRARERAAAEAQAEQARLDKAREAQMQRMMAGLPSGTGSPGSRGSAAHDAAPSAAYAGRLIQVIRGAIVYTADPSSNPAAEVELRATASGTIISRSIVKSSGVKSWDDAVLRGIDRLDRLPADSNGQVPTEIRITARPND
jgi:colicin import membrane protein